MTDRQTDTMDMAITAFFIAIIHRYSVKTFDKIKCETRNPVRNIVSE